MEIVARDGVIGAAGIVAGTEGIVTLSRSMGANRFMMGYP